MALSDDLCYSIVDLHLLLDYQESFLSVLQYFNFAMLVVTGLVGLVGNAVVICITGFIMKKHKTKYWFLNLAIADFLSLLTLPLHAVQVFKGNWPFGPHMCKLFYFSSCANMYTSIFILIALNIARVLSVAQPMFHRKFISQRVSLWICFLIRIITILSSLPVFFYSGEVKIGEVIVCSYFSSNGDLVVNNGSNVSSGNVTGDILVSDIYTKFNPFFEHCSSNTCCGGEETFDFWNYLMFTSKRFMIPFLIIGYFIPLGIVIICNITIVVHVRKSKTINTQKLYRVILMIIMVFFITWTPVMIANTVLLITILNMNLIIAYKIFRFMPLLISIAYTNNCLNPIMYVFSGGQMRTELSDFIRSIRNSYT